MGKRNHDDRIATILQTMHDVECSPLSVNQYFQQHATPFGRVQYYLYKQAIAERGLQGVCDQRSHGNHVKFTQEMKGFVKGLLVSTPSTASSDVQSIIEREFGVTISMSVLNAFRREQNLRRDSGSWQESGAAELLIALALASGLIETLTDAIARAVQQERTSERFNTSAARPRDHADLRDKGRFTSAYNTSLEVRKSRFQSLDEKLMTKRLVSMSIFSRSRSSLQRYTLALFSLPLVTERGRVRSVNNPRGNALHYLCGYNYKACSLTKHLTELKYLQLADQLIVTTAQFWIDFWAKRAKTAPVFACYYIDGNTKALWSSKPCHKGKVTMLGRVMNCLEQVFIHDGQGHPIYFQTFNGHADLGKNALRMMDRISGYLNEAMEASEPFSVTRVLIFDGGGNGVKTLRGLCQSDYHFITILDANQVTERKLKSVSLKKRYAYGDAYVVDCAIELEDSHEKGYLFETRAVQVHWDNHRIAVLITSLPRTLCSPDNVVKSYFDRWPAQELNFKDLKSRVNIHRVVGYGKKSVDNTPVVEKIARLQQQIQDLEHTLHKPLQEIRE